MSHTSTDINWREVFRHAVRDWHKREKTVRLEEASEAIQRRLRGEGEFRPPNSAERSEMESALYFLSLLSMAR
jgi:hypothetical protein